MKHLKFFLGFLLCLLALGVLAACGKGQLATPKNLKLIDEVLTWDEVEGAEKYLVSFDDEDYITETNSFDIFELAVEPKIYRMSVMALGNSETTFNSEFSKEFEYELQLAEGLMYSLTYGESGYGSAYAVRAEVTYRPSAEPPKGKVVIPAEYNGLPVTELTGRAFENCTEITEVIMPDDIIAVRDGKAMGNMAFAGCTGLKRIRLSASFTVIQSAMFAGCTSLIDVQFAESTEKIGSNAFEGCTSLTNIQLPENMQEIASSAFEGCTSLTNIQLPENIQEIGSCVFANTGIAEIVVPARVTKIEGNAFIGAGQLQRLVVAEENPIFRSEGNCVIRKSDNVLVAGCASSVIPSGVTGIGNSAFSGCKGLTSAQIPEGVRKIEAYAFYRCSNLTEVFLPNSLVSMSGGAFTECSGLTAIELPSGMDCYYNNLFEGCVNLESITMRGKNEDYAVEGNCIIRKADKTLVAGCKGSVIPNYVEVIGSRAFKECGPLGDFTIPYGVKKIEHHAFCKCLGLTSIRIPDSVASIGGSAFSECFDLTSVVIPESVEEVGVTAFDFSGTIYVPFVVRPDGWHKNWIHKESADAGNWAAGGMFGEKRDAGVYYDGIVAGCKLAYENHYPYVESFTFDVSAESATLVGNLIVPHRAGYTFLGWATEPNGNVEFGVEDMRIHYSKIHPFMGAPGTLINGVLYEQYDKAARITLPFRVRVAIENGTTLYAVYEKIE